MATFNFKELDKTYEHFTDPIVIVKINGKDFAENKHSLVISDLVIDVSSGYEAGMASFVIYNSYDLDNSYFRINEVKDYVCMGSTVIIYAGYKNTAREVFRGFISQVDFFFYTSSAPGVRVSVMDIKGLMMSGAYSKQLKAQNYADAVKEILRRTNYEKLHPGDKDGMITNLKIDDTPDKKTEASSGDGEDVTDYSMEMVDESDYEFVVRAAKKFNYEFFSLGGIVFFRKARSLSEILIELGPGTGTKSLEIGYDLTGQVESVEVRGLDVGKGKQISAKKKLGNKLSRGNKAKGLISGSQKIYIDPTVKSKNDATYRAEYLSQEIAYRLGILHMELVGMPELVPGRFIQVTGIGEEKNKFYITRVTHTMQTNFGFNTKIEARACSV